MRAILIDPENQTIREVEYNGNYRHIHHLIDCDCFTVVVVESNDKDGSNESIFVDDEGLLKEPEFFFTWAGYPQPLANKGLILGCDAEGESVATELTLEYVKSKVRFMRLSVQGFQQEEFDTDMFGQKFHGIRHTPVFGPPKDKEQDKNNP